MIWKNTYIDTIDIDSQRAFIGFNSYNDAKIFAESNDSNVLKIFKQTSDDSWEILDKTVSGELFTFDYKNYPSNFEYIDPEKMSEKECFKHIFNFKNREFNNLLELEEYIESKKYILTERKYALLIPDSAPKEIIVIANTDNGYSFRETIRKYSTDMHDYNGNRITIGVLWNQ